MNSSYEIRPTRQDLPLRHRYLRPPLFLLLFLLLLPPLLLVAAILGVCLLFRALWLLPSDRLKAGRWKALDRLFPPSDRPTADR